LAFLDEEEELSPAGGPPRRYGGDHQRQIMVRRAIAAGVFVLILILLVLGIRGCLNARKERNFENYASDLGSIVTQTRQLSDDFFGRLNDPGNLTPLSYEAEVKSSAGTAQGLLDRVEGLDAPDELDAAQGDLIRAYQLRADGLQGIAGQISTALGQEGRQDAVDSIANYMQYFLASDVLYAIARSETTQVLSDEDIGQQAPESVFIPDERWLDPLEISSALNEVSAGRAAASGTHGLALFQTTVKPGNVVLDPETPSTISGAGQEVDVQVQNQGTAEETDVVVSLELTGGTETITGEGTVSQIAAGAIQTASIPLQPTPETGQQLTLEVTVQPVPGEQIADNNRSTYLITFE
jgi:hypothetical protein